MAEKRAKAKPAAEQLTVIATKAYFDTQLNRIVTAGEYLEVEDARAEQLKAAGVAE